MIVLLTFYD